MENNSNKSPQEKWEDLKKYFIEQVEKIDSEVKWSPVEPNWWAEMSDLTRQMKK